MQSVKVQPDNAGNQYVALITNNATKLPVRRYSNADNKINGQDIQLGGMFEGNNVYILDSPFTVQPDSTIYAAAIWTNEKNSAYLSSS